MPVDVDGELLAEGQLHDGLVLAAPEEGEGAAQHAGDEGEQRPKHRLILAAAGANWESESRVEAGLSSTDQGNRGPGINADEDWERTGIAALLGMLTSCASNVTVLNIDNGFEAAYVATLINRL
jgi:hypothetical protein